MAKPTNTQYYKLIIIMSCYFMIKKKCILQYYLHNFRYLRYIYKINDLIESLKVYCILYTHLSVKCVPILFINS